MINILHVRPAKVNKKEGGGVRMYCASLYNLFEGDKEITLLRDEDYPSICLRFFNYAFKWKYFIKKIESSGADVLHINGYTSFSSYQGLKAAIKYHKRIVYTAHFHPFETLSRPLFAKLSFTLFIKPLLKKYVDIVVTINNEDTAYFNNFCKNVVRIPHALTFDVPIKTDFIKRPRMILFVGGLNAANKGLEHLYHLQEGKYEIHCVGDGELPEKRSDIIVHTNITTNELKNLYLDASLLVVPSKYEAFSYVTLEALSCNTPVVLSDKVRIADYIGDKPYCMVFKYHDYDGFCNAVESTIGKQVDLAILKQFSKENVKHLYKDVYLSLK